MLSVRLQREKGVLDQLTGGLDHGGEGRLTPGRHDVVPRVVRTLCIESGQPVDVGPGRLRACALNGF